MSLLIEITRRDTYESLTYEIHIRSFQHLSVEQTYKFFMASNNTRNIHKVVRYRLMDGDGDGNGNKLRILLDKIFAHIYHSRYECM